MVKSEIIKIECEKLPPSVDFIENEIKKRGFEPIRWAIVDVLDTTLTLSSAQKRNNPIFKR